MGKHKSEEAFNARMRHLANIGGTSSINENRSLGTLIDVKRAANGVAYGIVKENHQYYIKKGGLNENQDVSDFAYIGGLSNITEHQYPSLATADKNRNFLLSSINEALSTKMSKTGSKKVMLNEDNAEKEIAAATEKVDDLEAATDAAAIADVPSEPVDDGGEEEMAAGIQDMPTDEPAPEVDIDVAPEGGEEGGEVDIDVAPEGGEEAPEGGEEMPTDEPAPEGGEEAPEDEGATELQKQVSGVAKEIQQADLDSGEIKWLLDRFISAFKPVEGVSEELNEEEGGEPEDKISQLDINDRQELADMLLDVVSDEEKQSVADTVPQDGDEEMEEGSECSECGGFKEYAEARGYTTESLMECGDEEMANLMSGYANAHGEGQNDGDFQIVALLVTPEILEKLKSEYGHEEFAGQVEPIATGMDDETKEAELNELFGGLKNLGKAAGQGIKQGVQKVGQAVSDKAQQVGQGVQQAATNIKQTYHAGELGKEVKNLEKKAADLGAQVDALNKRMEKAGGQPLNVGSILTTIKNQIAGAKGVDLSKYGSVQEEGPDVPTDSLEVQPNMEETNEDVDIKVSEKEGKKLSAEKAPEVEMKEGKMSPGFQSMGAAVVKPESAPVTEAEVKLRKYIRNRLEEKAGMKKPVLNENKKSETLQKLDRVIDKQLELFEGVAMNELMGFSVREKFGKTDPNDPNQVETLFNKAFKDILINPQMGAIARAADTTSPEQKYEILRQYVEGGGGTLRLGGDRDTLVYAPKSEKDAATHSMFSAGGTQGRTKWGGTAG